MTTITATLPAFITSIYRTAESLVDMPPEQAIACIQIYPEALSGWSQIGTAEVTLTLFEPQQITANQVSVLKAAKKKAMADCEVLMSQIEGQIQQLLCIESKP